jgi:TolB protein
MLVLLLIAPGNADAQDSPASEASPVQIVFTTNRDRNQEIYLLNLEDSRLTNLTQSAGSDFAPIWSPDGASIAFTSDRHNRNEIFIWNMAQQTETLLTDGSMPAWTPDSRALIYLCPSGGVCTINADGSEPTTLGNDAASVEREPLWSPTGDRFLAALGIGSAVFAADGTMLNMFYSQHLGSGEYARWLPGGQKVAMWLTGVGLLVVDWDFSFQARSVTPVTGGLFDVSRGGTLAFVNPDFPPIVSPDGTKIVVNLGQPGISQIYVIDTRSGETLNLSGDRSEHEAATGWSLDGTQLLVISDRTIPQDLFILSLDGSEPLGLTRDTAAETAATWRPDPNAIHCTISARSGVNRRSGPGTSFEVTARFGSGETLAANGQATGTDGLVWWRLMDGSWVRSDLATTEGTCELLPFVASG